MKAGIVVDDWKLPVFRKRLTGAGYDYVDGGAFTPTTTLLTVQYTNVLALKEVIDVAQRECAVAGKPPA